MILMAVLGPKAGAIVEAGRSAIRATDADRDRVKAALQARLGPAALPLKAPAAPPTPRVWRFATPTLGVGMMGAALFLAFRPAQAPKPVPNPIELRAPEVQSPGLAALTATAQATALAPDAPVTLPAPSSAVAPPSAATAVPQPDQLAKEVALLTRATGALSAGRFGEALKVLNEHQRQFPKGLLNEERRAGQAQALCSLGRVSEGRAQLAYLPPRTPAATRAGLVCDSAAARAMAKGR